MGIDGTSPGAHPLVVRFLKGVRRHIPVSKPIAPTWDSALVLGPLCVAPFEPLELVDLKILSYKTFLDMALSPWHIAAKGKGYIEVYAPTPPGVWQHLGLCLMG